MTGAGVNFQEATGEQRVQSVPLAHASIEVGHLYREDLVAGPQRLAQCFQTVAPWAEAARRVTAAAAPKNARISTCLLVDDYSAQLEPPAVVVPQLLRAAAAAGVQIDYLAREAACAEAEGIPLASLVEARVVADPPPGSNGSRPPVTESGWLCNGQRSPSVTTTAAMAPVSAGWSPPAENSANGHSVFVDVELWDEQRGRRTWSCAFLATVWQLLRLGLLRCDGARVAIPQPEPAEFGAEWDRLPAITQLNPRAAPFCAYRSWSILPKRFFVTEHAVRTILGQVAVEQAVLDQIADRSRAEGISLPEQLVERIEYVFTG